MKAVMTAALAVVRRPTLWSTAIRQILTLAAPGWWRRRPFLPLPPSDYLKFRLETAYGGHAIGLLRSQDVIAYLTWCRAWRRSRRRL